MDIPEALYPLLGIPIKGSDKPIDLSYLRNLTAPNSYIGLAFDGQRVGIVAYSNSDYGLYEDTSFTPTSKETMWEEYRRKTARPGSYPLKEGEVVEEPKSRPKKIQWEQHIMSKPLIWAAYQSEECRLGKVFEILDALCDRTAGDRTTTMKYCTIIIEGTETGRNFLSSEIRKSGLMNKASFREFKKTSGRRYQLNEVIAAVLTDIRSDRIGILPLFEDRPERIELRSSLEAIEARDVRITALQEAFIFGLGYWSCVETRSAPSGVTDYRLW